MPGPQDFPFAHRLPTDVPTQIRATYERDGERSSRPRVAAVALVLAVVGGLGLLARTPDDAQVLSTRDCGQIWVTEEAGHVWGDEGPSC